MKTKLPAALLAFLFVALTLGSLAPAQTRQNSSNLPLGTVTPTSNNVLLGDGTKWNTANEATFKAALNLEAGTDFNAYDADLTTYAGIPPSANVQTLLGAADYAAFRTSLSLVVGTNVQAYDADLTTYAGITPSANVQTLLGAADYAAFKTSLSLNNVENTAVSTWAGTSNITTLGTVTTGTWNATDVPLSAGGTGATLSDPGADRIMLWDDSAGAVTWLEAGSGLSISGTTISVSGGSGFTVTELVAAGTSVGTGTTLDITSISGSGTDLLFTFTGVSEDTANRGLYIQPGVANAFSQTCVWASGQNGTTDVTMAGTDQFFTSPAQAATDVYEGQLWIRNYSNTTLWKPFQLYMKDADTMFMATGMCKTASAINALRVYLSASGNLDAGTYGLYAITY